MAAGQTVANLVAKLSLDTSGFQKGSNSTNDMMSKLGSVITGSMVKAGVAVKALSGAFNAVKSGASAVIGAFGNTIKASREAYASFEQLSGGAELMFGKAFDSVSKNAQNAWQTVQMSQNEYLQQANGFATGLKTALGGNEQAAADLAHKIIVAEADVISATGNSRDAVQNAFNGIMKSNYTMLDNLQLGIKPTKEGFQEMIDTVNDWNAAHGKATNYQIDNLAHAQAALVDYISMQGLAGYASREAAGTIEGATASVTAAWENVKVSLAGGGADITASFEALGTAAQSWLTNVVPRIGTIMGGIGDAMAKTIPGIGEKMIAVIPTIAPKFVAGGIKLGIGLVTGIGQGVKVLGQLLGEMWNQLKQIMEGLGLKQLGTNIIKSIWDGIKIGWNDMLAWVYTELGNLITKLETWLTEKLGKIADLPIIKDLFKDMKSSISVDLGGNDLQGKGENRQAEANRLRAEQTALLGDIHDSFETFGNDLWEKCNDILDGEDGISSEVTKAGEDIVAATGSGGTEGTEGETLYDQVMKDMQAWYESYAQGNYDMSLLETMQGHLDTLQSRGIYIANYDILNSGTIDPAVKQVMQSMPAVPDDLAKDASVQGVTQAVDGKDLTVENDFDTTGLAKDESVQGVTGAVNEKDWSPTIEAPALDPAPIASAISNVKVEPSIKATVRIPEIEVPEANVDVEVDTSILDTSATNLSGSATSLNTSASNLDTSATNLSSLATPQDIMQAYEGTTYTQNKWNVSGKAPGAKGAQQQGGALQTVQQISVPEIPSVPDEILESYQNLVTAIQNLNTAFQNLMATLSGAGGGAEGAEGAVGGAAASAEGAAGGAGGGSLYEILSGLPALFDNVRTAAGNLAAYFENEFVTSINNMLLVLCVTSVDEEGNVDANGGNTLYTAMGSIYGLFRDTFVTTVDLSEYWSGPFVASINTLKAACGIGKSATLGLASAAHAAAEAYFTMAAAIMAVVGALQALDGAKSSAGNIVPSTGNGIIEGAAASGAHVRAGETWLVGEEGPEVFTPDRDGYIIPNDELRGGSRTVDDRPINITIEGSVYGESYLKNYVVNTLTTTVKKELRLAAA